MPFSNIESAKKDGFPAKAEGIPMTLVQINKLSEIFDALEREGQVENSMAVAWTTWKEMFKKEGDKWVKKEKKTKNTLNYEIKSVPIFSIGRWQGQNSDEGGDVYTEADFDAMVESFNEIGERVKPYMKLGHDDKQKMLQRDGYPAAGWITNLYRVGSELIADISNIPKTIYELIKNKAYGRFSPEIVWNWEDTSSGKSYKRVLTALALLGADTPACDSPNDFINLYEHNAQFIYSENNESVKYYENKCEEKKMADVSKLEEKIEKLEAKLNAMGEKIKEKDEMIAKLKKNEKEIEDVKTVITDKEKEYEVKLQEKDKELAEKDEKLNEIKLNSKKEEVNNFLGNAVKEGKITPAIREYFSAVAMIEIPEQTHVYSYKTDEDAEKKIEYSNTFDLVKNIVDNSVKAPDFDEKSKKGEIKKNTKENENSNVDDSLDNKIRTYCKENNMNPDKADDYKMAFDSISNEQATKRAESRAKLNMEDE